MAIHLATQLFEDAGYEVFVAGNGVDGLAKAKLVRPSLIILEMTLPVMNGLEVCRRLRSEPDTAPIPIILKGAGETGEDNLNAVEVGADDYLQAPISPDELLIKVGGLLQ
jgi:two-component system alkaline phosphatase synthesis response regulator PhoP